MRASRIRSVLTLAAAGLIAVGLASLVPTGAAGAESDPGAPSAARLPIGNTGTWLTDADGRVVILHGMNQVYKVPPYLPSADGFGNDDAAFLAANGFNAVRLGVIWAGVEPRPGVYDDAYLAGIQTTVRTLAAHGIVSLLDFHQDLYNEKFQGEGAPAWAVQDGGRPNPSFGFPFNYFANPAEQHAWDAFWANAKAPDGIGLQEHYARAWAHVAARFANERSVLGYEIMNEPWPGTLWQPCAVPLLGCALTDAKITAFYQRVTDAIRAVDPARTVWITPNVAYSTSNTTHIGKIRDPHVGWSFHVYCQTAFVLKDSSLCPPLDKAAISASQKYAARHQMPWLLTEFGATTDLTDIGSTVTLADQFRLGWLHWAYTGNDKTSTGADEQAVVLDPSRSPTGANVRTDKLRVLARVYPQVVAGTPASWSFDAGTFRLSYSTARADGSGRFGPGARTVIAVPAIQYPSGYRVGVTGGHVVSAPGASRLVIAAEAGATSVTVTVTAG